MIPQERAFHRLDVMNNCTREILPRFGYTDPTSWNSFSVRLIYLEYFRSALPIS